MPTPETIEYALSLARNARGLIGIAQFRLRELIGGGHDKC
jgi:hypothetical protein